MRGPSRKVFPYSVIPGGVASGVELRTALFKDSVAKAHYADFRVDQTRVEHLAKAKRVFVSYRIADRVYWTKKRISLPQGEAILTDGVSSARTRCGNRLSDTPQSPTNKAEPAADTWDAALLEEEQTDAWGLRPEAAKEASVASKVKSSVSPPGDYLANFGPQSLASGAGSSSGAWGGGGGGGGFGGGGAGNAGGSSGAGSGATPAPITSPAAFNLPPDGGTSGSTPVTTLPSGPGVTGAPPQLLPLQGAGPAATGPAGTHPGAQAPGPNSYPMVTQVVTQANSPSSSVAEFNLSVPSLLTLVPVSVIATPLKPNPGHGAIPPSEDIVEEVQAPEPRTLILFGSAIALLFYVLHRRRPT